MKTSLETPSRVCLITPPSVFLLDERVFMNLGILKVASVLERSGVRVELLDMSGIKNYLDAVKDHAAGSAAVHFGVTATTPQLPAAVQIASSIRAVRSDARIILGGPHATLVHAAAKRESALALTGRACDALKQLTELFDVVVAGDGEEAVFLALMADAPSIIDADDPKTELFLSNDQLSELPFPARHLLDVESYRYHIDGERALSLISQLGCPFECGFCGGRQSPFLRRVRSRPSENVVAEMVHMYKNYGVKGFMFYDDELNVNRNMIKLMQLIIDTQESLGTTWRLRGFVKAQLFNEEQAANMYRAGFRWLLVGFESGAPRILDNINKRSTLEENNHCLQIARQAGLKVKALMSVGHPGESRETVQATRDWLIQSRPDDFDVSIITPYPGSPYYDRAVRHPQDNGKWVYTYEKTGDRLYSREVDYAVVADYYKGVPGEYKSYVHTDSIGPTELAERRDWMEDTVREDLGVPFNSSMPSMLYEHSMGQSGGILPSNILRTSKA